MSNIDFSPMKDKPDTPKVGVGVLIWKGDGKEYLLLGKRRGSHGAGKWSLPGGHIDLGEHWEETCVRETLEECDIRIDGVCQDPFITNNVMEDEGLHYITIFCQAVWDKKQEPVLKPEEKFEEWRWVPWGEWEELDLFAGLAKRLEIEHYYYYY